MFLFLNELLHPEIISPEMGLEIIETLKHQAIRNKLPALLPPSTVIAHKTGELDGAEHDAGIVFCAEKRCIIVTMTKSLSRNDDGVSFCREIGRMVVDAMSGADRVRSEVQ
jgi:beta-lactamase class A